MMKRTALLAVLAVVVLGPLHALPPVVIAGLHGGTQLLGSEDEVTAYPFAMAQGSLNYREALEQGGYFAASATGTLRHFVDPVSDFEDDESVSIDLALPIREHTVKLGAGLRSSFHDLGGAELLLRPDWRLSYSAEGLAGVVIPELSYRGLYRYEHAGAADRLEQLVALGVSHDPSIRFSYDLGVEAGYERRPEEYLFDEQGNRSGTVRQDYTVALNGSAAGLIGFFTTWDVSADAGFRESNDNRYLPTPGTVEENSEDRLFGGLSARLGLSPVRHLNLETGLRADEQYYLKRAVLDSRGEPTGSRVNVFSLGGSLHVDWTPNDALYFVADARVSRSFSQAQEFAGWNAELRGGIEYSF